ncbi:MAG: hypothetical protein NTZ61_19525 [Proteobacteria bacterium]|nr:hypothetical protein [Pseudomonadota bacterium]
MEHAADRKPLRLVRVLPLLLVGCGRLDALLYEPPITPAQWCQQRPCVELSSGSILNEPFGTTLVFFLAGLWIAAGVYEFAIRDAQKSRVWLAIALILGGVGAALAGTSFQAFSYELKCAGREHCLWTNGFEIGYNLAQAASVSAMLIAVAYACTTGRVRRGLIRYSIANVVAYFVVTSIGVLRAERFLLSFDMLMLFALPGLIAVLAISGLRYRRLRDGMALALLGAGVWLVVTFVAYYSYYAAGLTQAFWRGGQGFYFSENDVLHIGMALWIVYVALFLARRLRDADDTGTAFERRLAPGEP